MKFVSASILGDKNNGYCVQCCGFEGPVIVGTRRDLDRPNTDTEYLFLFASHGMGHKRVEEDNKLCLRNA